MTRHPALFQKELGECKGPAATIVIDPNETPRFFKAHSVPYALRKTTSRRPVEAARSRRLLTPVEHATWVAPILPVVKPDRSIHICSDFEQSSHCFHLASQARLFRAVAELNARESHEEEEPLPEFFQREKSLVAFENVIVTCNPGSSFIAWIKLIRFPRAR